MTIHVIGNPAAGVGTGAPIASEIARRVGGTPHAPRSADDTRLLVEELVAANAERVVACGGDGIVHLIGQAVAGTRTILGIVPVGTGNDIARGLGIESGDLDAMAEQVLADATPIDAIRTDYGWALSIATLGFAADVNDRADRLRWPKSASRYTAATLLELPRLEPKSVTITVDGTRHDVDTLLFAAANTPFFGGGMAICPDADPTDGQIDLTIIGPVGRATFARVFPRAFKGTHVEHRAVATDRGSVVHLGAGAPGSGLELWADGERLGPLPVTLEAVPGALLVAGARPAHP